MDKIEFLPATSVIPLVTHPWGSAWHQPDRADIDISPEFARMRPETCKKLAEYSRSIPSGVYEGKMWRSIAEDGTQYLMWFGASADPNKCAIHRRQITLDFL